jgi:isocitrate dehydrogenase (NAD+)
MFVYSNKVPIVWEDVDVTPFLKNGVTTIPEEALNSVNRNKVALKGIKLLIRSVSYTHR